MENDPNRQLEQLIQRELEKLPELSAPNTLIPCVMAGIHAKAQAPAWRRSWWTWPLKLKVVSAALLLTLIAVVFYGGNWAAAHWDASVVRQPAAHWWNAFVSASGVLSTLGHALFIAGRSIGQIWLVGILALAFLMYLTCVGVGTICFRVAVNQR